MHGMQKIYTKYQLVQFDLHYKLYKTPWIMKEMQVHLLL